MARCTFLEKSKIMKKTFSLIVAIITLLSCADDDNGNFQIENQNPDNFTVQPGQITDTSSLLTWDSVSDPDGDTVTYAVFLGENQITSQLSTTQFLLEGLSEQTSYSGKVVADDGNNGFTESNFSFTTLGTSIEIGISWQKSLGGSQDDVAYKIIQTTDLGFIVAGSTGSNDGDVSNNNGNTDCWIVKLDASGNIEWEISLGGSNNETVHDIKQTADGGYIVGAFSSSNDGDISVNNGMRDFWIIKLDSAGNINWSTTVGGSSDDILEAIIETSDGSLVAVGFTSSDKYGVNGQSDAFIVKLDNTGELLWQTNLGGSLRDIAFSIDETTDLGYILAGYTEVSSNNREMWLIKLNENGGFEWDKEYGGSENEEAVSIQQTTDSGYIIGGYSTSDDGDIVENKGGRDAVIIKTDQNGNIIWQKAYGGSQSEGFNEVRQTNDGGYICIGGSSSNDLDIENNSGAYDFWIVKTSSNGEIVWQQNLGGEGNDTGYSIKETNDGGFIAAGYWYTNITGNGEGTTGDDNYWVIKLN